MYNKVTIIGNVGGDPEMRYVGDSGSAVTSFSVASNRVFTTAAGEKREETEWFQVSAWNRLAEITNEYVVKGMLIFVEGTLTTHEYTRQDGSPGFSLRVNAREIKFLSKENGNAGERRGTGASVPPPRPPQESADDLPW